MYFHWTDKTCGILKTEIFPNLKLSLPTFLNRFELIHFCLHFLFDTLDFWIHFEKSYVRWFLSFSNECAIKCRIFTQISDFFSMLKYYCMHYNFDSSHQKVIRLRWVIYQWRHTYLIQSTDVLSSSRYSILNEKSFELENQYTRI